MKNIFKKFGQVSGKTFKLIKNGKDYLKEEVIDQIKKGYRSTRKSKCLWCKQIFPMDELKEVMDKKYLLCPDCLDSMTVFEAQSIDKPIERYIGIILDRMFEDVALSYSGKDNTRNGFIEEANKTLGILIFEEKIKLPDEDINASILFHNLDIKYLKKRINDKSV